MNQARLFVGNLAYTTADNDLTDLFAQAGVVVSASVVFDKLTGKSRGFAFVEMGSSAEANKAVELFHGKDFQGRGMTVNIARPKEDRPPREGGGYRGGGGGGGGYRGGGGAGGGGGYRGERGGGGGGGGGGYRERGGGGDRWE
ncbi:MAG: RNA recognition motif domain-containing protein [Limisphaerales bacterium]